jgi:DNA polymerase-1
MLRMHGYCAERALGHDAPIATKFARARRDPIATLIAGLAAAGIRFRWSGATLFAHGLERLSDRDAALFWTHQDAVLKRLRGSDDDGSALLDRLEIWVEVVRTREDAARIIAELPASCGLDCETAPLPEYKVERPWLVITKKGELAKHQPDPRDKAGLDPHKARVRLVQVYIPEHEATILFDLDHLSIETLAELGLFDGRKFVAHNAAFEYLMLHGHERGITLVDSMQLAGLLLGCGFGARTLANVADKVLGIELTKEQQQSDWNARHLSHGQVNYAAADACVAYRAARVMWRLLSGDERRCFDVQNAAIPAIARMRLVGCPFDPGIHRETIRRWEVEHAEERARFKALTGQEPPARDKVGRWLEAHLPAEELAWMPRTSNGTVSARSDLLKHLARHAEIRPLLKVLWSDKRLRTFGHKLLEAISPVTGRVHPDYMLGTKAGRLACADPNFQQLPSSDVRRAIVAPSGKLLVVADYAQIELRVLAELSGDAALREEFATGGDVHRAAAAAIAGVPVEQVTPEQRRAAKAIVFGTVYGAGAKGIRASAWAGFDIDLTEAEAGAARSAFLFRYSGVATYQQEQADVARATGVVRSVLGRPLKAEWEGGRLKYTQAVNFPIQSSAADVMLIAMAKVDRALPSAMVLQVHDELVLEVPEAEAEAAAATLVACMIEAFGELFPAAPTVGLVSSAIVNVWSEAK